MLSEGQVKTPPDFFFLSCPSALFCFPSGKATECVTLEENKKKYTEEMLIVKYRREQSSTGVEDSVAVHSVCYPSALQGGEKH